MTSGPVGPWEVRLRTLGNDSGRCRDLELAVAAGEDGSLLIRGAGDATLGGTWRLAGAGRVVASVRSDQADVEVALELGDDGRSVAGRASIRGGDRTVSSRSRPRTAEVIGRRPLLWSRADELAP